MKYITDFFTLFRYALASLFLSKADKVALRTTSFFLISESKGLQFLAATDRVAFNLQTVPQYQKLSQGKTGGLVFLDPLKRVVVYKEMQATNFKDKQKVKV
jgi:hypothetical protein